MADAIEAVAAEKEKAEKYAVDMVSGYDSTALALMAGSKHCGVTSDDMGFIGKAAWLGAHLPGVLDDMEDVYRATEHAAFRPNVFTCVRKIVEGTCPLFYVKV